MTNLSPKRDRKALARQEYEEHFYATWPTYLDTLNYEELSRLNAERLTDVNAGWPETMLWLKHEVLFRMAIIEGTAA